jgi:hypothetical protein
MRVSTAMIAGLGMMGALCLPAQLSAEVKIYPYPSSANYCPAGLQPVTFQGVISCGTPNQTMTYQQVMAHPVQKKRRWYRYSCIPGEKGCS